MSQVVIENPALNSHFDQPIHDFRLEKECIGAGCRVVANQLLPHPSRPAT